MEIARILIRRPQWRHECIVTFGSRWESWSGWKGQKARGELEFWVEALGFERQRGRGFNTMRRLVALIHR